MKKICIALDTSPSAEKVAKIGFNYAQLLKSEVVLIHVVNHIGVYVNSYNPIMNYNGFLINRDIEIVESLEKEAIKFLESTANFLGEPSTEIKVLNGDPEHQILTFVEEYNADLLVIGTHSHSFLEDVLMGNIAAQIVKNAKTPILVIPVKG
ncbi:universal stress protein [Polaribacter sp.]|uniref:universal stress protein n=1 Tax=Polaribacter sp. TaxID=1920175 RepID=UPI003F6CBE7F